MDIYKLGFVIVQIVSLIWLARKVQQRHKLLSERFIAQLKGRLIATNLQTLLEEKEHKFSISLSKDELKHIDLTRHFLDLQQASDEIELVGCEERKTSS